MKLIISNDWEKWVDDNGETIIEGHVVNAEDILFALGYRFEIEEVEEDED